MDILARTLAPHFQSAWGQAIVVDNRPGASATRRRRRRQVGARRLTLLMGVNTLIINPALYGNMTYDPLKDLAPIGLCATGSFLLVAGATMKIGRSTNSSRRRARSRARSTMRRRDRDAASHGDGALQAARQGVDHAHPVFRHRRRGDAVLSGDVPLMFLPVHVAMAQVKGGRLVVLAAAGNRHRASRPTCRRSPSSAFATSRPTSGTECSRRRRRRARSSPGSTPTWRGARAARSHDRARRAGNGGRARLADEMAALMRRDAARWAAVVKQAGIKAE
jgi:tripartite-type tricarboxylate transporter receptor subunit TctC